MNEDRQPRDKDCSSIAVTRMRNQHISEPLTADPVQTVRWMGAVQAQDYAAAKWAVGLRTAGSSDATITAAFNEGLFLRTHVLRPTWHFVSAEDIQWMLTLTGPRVNQTIQSMCRRLGLDDKIFSRSEAVFRRAPEGGNYLKRTAMIEALKQDGIGLNNLAYVHLIMRAELDGVICSGPRDGNQFTYALLDERAPHSRRMEPDEALAELTIRYFTSHGPATVKDFSWWSGLKLSDARRGLTMAADKLDSRVMCDVAYWFCGDGDWAESTSKRVHLLPNYDEYVVGYVDRSAYWHASHSDAEMSRSNPLFNHTVVIDGRIRGTWTRKLKQCNVEVTVSLFEPIDRQANRELDEEIERYGQFLGLAADRI